MTSAGNRTQVARMVAQWFTSYATDFQLGILNLRNVKHFENELNEGLMLIGWHPGKYRNFCMSEDEKKEMEPIFTE